VPEHGQSKARATTKALKIGVGVDGNEELQLEYPVEDFRRGAMKECVSWGELNDSEPWSLSHPGFNKWLYMSWR